MVLVNSDPSDFKKIPCKTVELSAIDSVKKKSIIIVEDIISVSRKEEQQLRLCLNKFAHHKLQKYFFISHSVFKTTMFGMLPFFNYIIIIKSETNLKILKDILNYFRIDKSEFECLINNFNKICRQFPTQSTSQFFFFSTHLQKIFFCQNLDDSHGKAHVLLNQCTTTTMARKLLSTASPTKQLTLKNRLNAKTSKNEKDGISSANNNQELHRQHLKDRFEHLTSFFEKKDQALILFDLILPCLNETTIRSSDLTVCFHTNNKTIKRISLLNYITSLLDKSKKVSIDLKVLHHYLNSKCIIPLIFIENKNFR